MNPKEAFGAGLFAGALTGMIAGYRGGKLGLPGFAIFLLTVAPIKPGGSKVVAMVGFAVAAAFCIVIFRR